MKYLLDANIFITAKNTHYGFDFVPAFWDWLDRSHAQDLVWSTRKVRTELMAGQDELAQWVHERPAFFLTPDSKVAASMQQVASWAESAPYDQAALAEFFSVADFELVAMAHAQDCTVVTHERPRPNAKKRILIPDACEALRVAWIDPYTMLRECGAEFVLN